jgi:glycosyltransferase involved in cell wall biosynthesis
MKHTDIMSLKILTNHWGQSASPTWRTVTTYLPPNGNDLFSTLKLAFRLYSKRKNYDCVVLGAGRSDMIFALMQSILPFRKVPTVMIDCLWGINPNIIRHSISKLIYRIINISVNIFVVWAKHEINAFSEVFNLPKEKFVFIPYHTTIEVFNNLEVVEGDYIFSGGNSDRDYVTLIEAVRGLPVKLVIASTISNICSNISIPTNVTIKSYSNQEYINKMAGCRINVVALSRGRLRSAGQQTFLNSMLLGKPTIVTDDRGPSGYIENGVDGLLVPACNPIALREAIMSLLDNPEKAREMGRNAMIKAKEYSTEHHFMQIVSLVKDIINPAIKQAS